MKSEREKMLSGELYNCSDPELQERWHLAKDLIREFNNTNTRDKLKIDTILTALLGSKGNNLAIAPPFFCDYGENIHIGRNAEINHNCVFLDCNKITIGHNVLIAPYVQLYTVYHPLNASQRIVENAGGNGDAVFCLNLSKPIIIEDNVWIGGGSIILPGVTIGNGAVVGAGSVVTRDVPAGTLVYGNPARVIREIT